MDAHQTAERISTEVRNLLASLNEQNQESVVQDLAQYLDNGPEESILVVITCMGHFNINEDGLGDRNMEPTIASILRILIQKPHFGLAFTGLVKNRRITEEFLDSFSAALKLSVGEKVGFGLTLLDSEKDDVKIEGRKFCISQCEELCDNDEALDTDAAEVLDVLSTLEKSEALSKHVDSFKAIILEVWLNANCRFILADKVPDVKILSRTDFHINVDPTEMSTQTSASRFAKMLGSWNQLSYHCGGLRADGFQLCADVTFSLLMSCYRNACQKIIQDPFPLDAVCGNVWEISESQLLFLKQAVTSQPEVFTFAHSKRQMEYVNHQYQLRHAIQPWLCLDLLEVLCLLAENGHADSVRSIMEFPLKNFPEVVLLGMAHVVTSGNLLQHEVSVSVLPMVFKDSSKSGIILRLWDANPLLLSRALKHSLVLDLENMSKVVDLFEKLEILSPVLDLVTMALGIKLASLASAKEFLDLEEWLGTNLRESEDIFVEECHRFLNEVEENSGDIWNIFKETVPVFSKVLKSHADLLASNKLSEQMASLNVACSRYSPETEDTDDPEPSTSESYADHTSAKMQNSSSHNSIAENQSSFLKTHLLSLLPTVMHKAVDELLATTVNRSVSIASQTAIELALKDYTSDPDEDSIYNASAFMVTSLAGSLSFVTCQEPLRNMMSTLLQNAGKDLNFASELLEDTIKRVVGENLYLGCASIERDATEKGLIIVKREINLHVSIRKKQIEGSQGFISKAIEPSFTTDVVMSKILVLLRQLECLIANDATQDQLQYAAAEVRAVILKCIRKDEAALVVAQKVFEGLYINASNTASIDSHLTVLATIFDVNKLVQTELTGWVLNADDKKFNRDITVGLIRRQLLNLAEYSAHMARLIYAGKSVTAIEFAFSLVKTLEASDARVLSELGSVIDALSKVTYLPVARNDDNLALISSEPDPLPGQMDI
ncbi:uncharacterized protein LOC143582328 [Bidens hawaiensis]|uniref:uncharacterized protein LOC143582328 n=1 Tax=Bidens hawaiensis TaxID=980011 RepID=UPI004048F9B4